MREQDAAALGGAHPAPGAVERGPRRGDRGVDVGRAAARDAARARCRRTGLERERLAAVGSAPVAADQHGVGREGNDEAGSGDRGVHGGRLQRPRGRLCAIIRTSPHRRGPAISFFLAKRFASFVLTLLAASVVIFTVLDVLPGNAAEVMLGESATPESLAALHGQARPRPAAAGALRRLDEGLCDRRARHQHRLRHADRPADRRAAAGHAAAGADGDGADDGARLRARPVTPRRATTGPATSASWRSASSASRSRASGSRSC